MEKYNFLNKIKFLKYKIHLYVFLYVKDRLIERRKENNFMCNIAYDIRIEFQINLFDFSN